MTNVFPNYFDSVKSNFSELHLYFPEDYSVRVLQIGVYTGDASLFLLQAFANHKDFLLVDVDTWKTGDSKEMSHLNFREVEVMYLERTELARNAGRLITHKMKSDVFFALNSESFDLVYVDGSHECGQIVKDAINAFDCLKEGGLLAFDDYLGAKTKPFNQRPQFAIDLFLQIVGERAKKTIDNYKLCIEKI